MQDRMVIFNAKWYATMGVGRFGRYFPWLHYLFLGGFRGQKPSPLFDSAWYLERYPDVREAGLNPLVHYLTSGAREGRDPSPYFDSAWYLARYPDVANSDLGPLAHYLRFGGVEGRDPNPVFSSEWYVRAHPEIRRDHQNPLEYFVETGSKRGEAPGPLFDPVWYTFENPDVAAAGVDPLIHYLQYGRHEKRRPSAGPNHFTSVAAIASRLSELPPRMDAVPASAVLKLSCIEQVCADPEWGVDAKIILRSTSSAEGIIDPLPYPREAVVSHLTDVHIVGGTRYVVGGHAAVIHDEEEFFRDEPGAWVKYSKARRLDNSRFYLGFGLRQLARLRFGINLLHEYSSNYFHFVTEVLPRLLLAEEAHIAEDVPLLVDEGLHENLKRLLCYANARGRRVVELERATLYGVDTLYFPSDTSVVVDAYEGGVAARCTALDIQRIRAVVQHCREAMGTMGAPLTARKIYAARRGAVRNLLNQSEIELRLSEMGFDVVYPEKLSIDEQISVFEHADVVVGPTGAQMTNIVWCKPGAHVLVLASDHYSHQLYMWQLLGRASGAEVSILQGPRAHRRNDIFSVHDDYHVDIAHVVDALRASEKSRA